MNMSKYELVEKPLVYLNTFKLTIIADSNDGDYVTETEYFSKSAFEKVIDELINLRDNYGGSHQLEKYPNEFDLEIPYNGWDGYCHTLEELAVEYIDENGKLWEVKLKS